MKKTFAAFAVIVLSALLFTGCEKADKKADAANKNSALTKGLSSAHRLSSDNNLKQIGSMLNIFETSNDHFPATLSELALPGNLLIAPYDKKSRSGKSSYIYLPGKIRTTALRAPGKFPVVMEDPRLLPEQSTTLSVLYADGHVGSLSVSKVNGSAPLDIAERLISAMDSSDQKQYASIIRKTAEKSGK